MSSVFVGMLQWGNVAEWLAAVGTVGALAVALFLLKQEIDDRRRAESQAEQRPASGIFAWAEPRTDAGGWQTFALNRSDQPVYDAVVYFTPLRGRAILWSQSAEPSHPDHPSQLTNMVTHPETSLAFLRLKSSSQTVADAIGAERLPGLCNSSRLVALLTDLSG